MESDLKQQLRLVDQELHQVQDQIQSLLQHQESLLEQQAELQQLIASCRDVAAHDENGNGPGASKSGGVNWSGSFEWDNRAADIRLNLFGIKSYRQNQHEIINAVMSGRDVIVIMAAGGGKSLCYQLPAMLRTGTALVISPLLSLIQDQVMGLTALGISASMLTSTTTKDEEKSIYKSLEKGEGDLKILYVTPEKVAKSKRFVSKLEKCNHGGRLSLIAIDEAHCCSQWGHDFRPDYKQLGILKKQFPRVPMIALTATATERVQTDLREMLQITRCEKFVSTVNRPNLFYEVREKKANGSAAIDDIASFILDKYSKKESGIVYCFSRKECEQVAAELRKRGISAAHYHADMKPETRSSVHMRWSTNKLQVIVGTVAFGMGINKPDVRFVIHHSLSKSLETYYQESGRAGRDGLPAHCLLYFRPADLPRQSSMVFAEMAGLHNLYAICRFCQSKQACRRAAFFRHFGEKIQKCNGMCDNCAFTKEVVDTDVTEHARSLVSMVKESNDVEQKLTILQLVEQWRSQTKKSDTDAQLAKDLSKDDVERVIVQLILDGILKEEFAHTAYATNAYVALGTGWRGLLQGTGNRKVKLEIVKGAQSAKKKSKANTAPISEEGMTFSGLGSALDDLRQNLAASHGGIFPHSVLTSQHISLLASQKPVTMEELEEVIGKRIAEQYGNEILVSITDYLEEHPADTENGGAWIAPKGKRAAEGPSTGQAKRVAKAPSDKPTKAPATRQSKRVAEGPAHDATKTRSIKNFLQKSTKADTDVGPSNTARSNQTPESFGPSTTKTPTKRLSLPRPSAISTPAPTTPKEEDVKQEAGKVPQSECIDLDSDSEGEEDQPALNGTVFKRENEEEDVIEETSSEEDEFSLFKRLKRQ
ncbi:ATP-dependent DNA helicase Q-like 2 isoform X1 [Physcomitrium patens]|uniref:ATP-dependent DNA helicase n=1 Tax=Physcomitrium patens TaxID=3218 RepID=A0A2K1KKA0_PHYPA|nr:mediator of RNA polymerase II transcription subunit 34-like [Physcomitrium patens]PNR54208.1 hypothetical protein PHYPA_007885 [Physcomitrium patens]|eukprot:XP_024375691.1 mediator of RNA polymerase II transcription subunit 34-like [Physcomitrella patens]